MAYCRRGSHAAFFLQLQNLGLFPVDGIVIKITIPVATRGGNRLLHLTGFRGPEVSRVPAYYFGSREPQGMSLNDQSGTSRESTSSS